MEVVDLPALVERRQCAAQNGVPFFNGWIHRHGCREAAIVQSIKDEKQYENAMILIRCMPASMTAAWINNELIMAERTSYPERRRDMELQLLRELREKEEKGFIVLVEEENSFITGRVGQRVRLRDPFMNGRPVLIEAMQIYKELERQKAIKLPRKESGKYILHLW